MNPEEGELRPQLHDRLAFHVEVKGLGSLQGRLKVMKQAMEFDRDPIYFKRLYEESDNEITSNIIQAQKLLPKVTIKEDFLRIVARMCIELDVDGHRPDIIITRAAMTKAAYDGRNRVTEDDMIFASELTLGFRMRRTPFEEAALGSSKFQQVLEHAKKLEAEEKKKKRKAKAQKEKSKGKKTTASKKTTTSAAKKKSSSKK
jgi:Mg-chelatase subunit ChlI